MKIRLANPNFSCIVKLDFTKGNYLTRKMTGVVKSFDCKSGKGFIISSDRRKDVFLHISALNNSESQTLSPGVRVEFYRINGLSGPMAANIFLS